ncbi:cysteine synthase B [Demequina mangrovi]|uniref:Cysteine synthase n=2 Tax=Demequina mangrovi TaxID=1043493 RepID=A0A1H6X0R0_9MICO|nr:cysteine synthase CysM [Demequina mangrovi]SEJ18155.1 cysteine synthase B [Demequina mangrovi]
MRGMRDYPTIEETIGRTPLVRLQRLAADAAERGTVVLAKLEGTNPAGSVKDRPALSMIATAEAEGRIRPGDTVIEATSGNTGIALAMVAAVRGYAMVLVMPADLSVERARTMTAYGARLVLTDPAGGMELARTTADAMEAAGEGVQLDQFANPANPAAHMAATAEEIWSQTGGRVTHFVSSMGTTGTLTGTGRRLRELSDAVRIVGVQPEEGSRIPGIRAWEPEFLPRIFDPTVPHEVRNVNQDDATRTTRALAREEGILAGMSAGGAAHVALGLAATERDATIVFIVPDRGDRYLSTDLFATD